ncbi:MAG: peptide chain release factor-like protein [Pseudomonadota bacterium]|nr:peptide chain release factor-like protein [Pseudomonadota bacterium]
MQGDRTRKGPRPGSPAAAPALSFDPRVVAREVRVETFRASGPGGQHLHKTESAVRMIHEPTGIAVTVSDTRSQARNRALALERLIVRLKRRATVAKPRIATRRTRASVQRRLDQKRLKARGKKLRAPLRGSD